MKLFTNGIATNYELESAGTTVTAIHALGLDLHLWDAQVPVLAAHHQFLRYDVRGHGQSDKPPGPYWLELFAEDLHGLLLALGITQTHLVGVSMGGMIAQSFALEHPEMVSSLVLADTASDYPPEGRRIFEGRARMAEEQGMVVLVDGAIERWFTPAFRQTGPDVVGQIRRTLLANDPRAYAASCRAIAGLDLTSRLGAIHCPTLVLVGEHDTTTPLEVAQRIHHAISGSLLQVIPGAAHLANVEQAETFNTMVDWFVDEVGE